jgi:hypothetical protein
MYRSLHEAAGIHISILKIVLEFVVVLELDAGNLALEAKVHYLAFR